MYLSGISNQIPSSLQQLGRVKGEVRQREETIKEKQQFLENEIDNNKEQEKKISLAERTAARMRLEFQVWGWPCNMYNQTFVFRS